ncbi:ABC transporter transmembrane domain-containing protein [Halalkalibacterium halodurans]|uniref:ABC transporter (ATP-binding protein) n=1 Tax=Halalkalibacterium halodurans (strain ATCC BAA-125 / DSM 18197 / FERM 7344 / JCM 9153 / C-125) TaxID=272558 RepID=Q9KAF1_HALH5|nr:ABC transporter transmembrane domain-containing protein [Halalkalibacterium halodurans]MED3648407.1 ABC transporter transmembrane domain-containing protein [Halalkalibacterium halodurans]MED4080881.1 ABC transporter transmembrane domain-containing protein [Halalkalibacterium halodurans]MED4085064.1 ABC transporter transmembrane domain-containing protein [Halalkalibacterium halodurans]MED4105358.1 ABC transporter transmembrane domain-containing protein [Halalkalibacterium halodurans]MED41091
MKVFVDLWWFFKQEKKSYGFGIVMLAIVSLLTLVPPRVVGIIVDHIYEGTLTMPVLLQWIGVLAALALIVYVARYLWRVMIFGASLRLARLLRNQLYTHFTNMAAPFYQKHRTGDLMAHATNDIRAIQATAGQGVLTLVDSLTMGGFVILTMAITISWELTLISLLPMPLMALLTSYYGSLLHKRFHHAQAAFSSLNDKVQESVTGVRVTKAFGQEEQDIEAFRKQSDDVVKKNVAVARVDALFDPTISLIVGLSYFLAIVFGARFVIAEQLTIGQLTSFTIYLGLLIWPMLAFGFLFNIVERGRASYNRVSQLLQAKQEITDSRARIHVPPTGHVDVAIDQFVYPNQKEPALADVQFELSEGETLGIVGKTGAGKTTLLRLLQREYDIKQGTIILDGRPIEHYTLDALKAAFGTVPQDHFLFSATIADNIAFAKPDATISEIIQVSQLAHIHDDIIQFEQGYDTVVGERGVTLSGGQKQRVSIARALLANPNILILDDSLSAVDAKTEEAILSSLRAERKGKTTIITAHRLSAIKHADHILVMDDGRIVERGTHETLMEAGGWYRNMYERQQLETLVEKGGRSS